MSDTDSSLASPLRVMHVVLSLDVGGLERVVLALARQAPACRQAVTVLCLTRPGELAPQVEALGARVISLAKPPGLTPRLITRIRSLLREIQPDVVHTHQIGALLYAGPAARREGVPVVHTEHTNHLAIVKTTSQRLRVRGRWWLAGRYAQNFFCVSEDGAAAAASVFPRSKISVIPNGVDVPAFASRESRGPIRQALGIPADAPVIGTVGRLNEVKCQDLLIRGFADVQRAHPAARLLLVGDGPCRAALESLARDLGLAARVHFAGYQPAPQRYLAAMDVFALTSRTEGMPLAILEAWAARLPVVASRVGGIPKLIDDAATGLLFESANAPALAAALARVLDDAPLAARLSAAGLGRVTSDYSAQRMAAEYHGHYVAARHPASPHAPRRPAIANLQLPPQPLQEQSRVLGVE